MDIAGQIAFANIFKMLSHLLQWQDQHLAHPDIDNNKQYPSQNKHGDHNKQGKVIRTVAEINHLVEIMLGGIDI
ncbi:hypothetical protein D3C87_1712090 [compost metagenome]